jgi:hypothetical protein
MAAVVASADAIAVLEETGRLSEAYLYTDGPQAALESAIELASKNIRVVWNLLPKIRPLTQVHLSAAEVLFQDARDVRKYLQEKLEED